MTKKISLTLVISILVVAASADAQTGRRLLKNMQPEDFSPNSKLVSFVQRFGKGNDMARFVVLNARTLKPVYGRNFGPRFPFEGMFLSNDVIILRTNQKLLLQPLTDRAPGAHASLIDSLEAMDVRIDAGNQLLYFLVPEEPSDPCPICRLNLKTGQIDTFQVGLMGGWLNDFAPCGKDTFIVDFEDGIAVYSLSSGKESILKDSRGNQVRCDGGTVCVLPNRSGFLFANKDTLFMFTFRTNVITDVMPLHGFSAPMLAPDGSILVLSKPPGMNPGSTGSAEMIYDFHIPRR